MHALLEHTFPHVQVHVCDMVMLMEVEKGFDSFSKIFWRLEPKLQSCVFPAMSPNLLLCIDGGGRESFGDFSCHLMEQNTNTKKGRAKMHAKLQCQMN
jgi:hypothetical protein